jgi:protoporphyrinogen oxidase
MAGFGAGHVLHSAGVPFACYDKNPYYGGHARSICYKNGFVFDEGVHISFTKYDHIKRILAGNVDNQYEEKRFLIDNYWRGYRIPHPVQCNLRGLPIDLIIKIITDFTEVRPTVCEPVSTGTGRNAGDRTAAAPCTYADWLRAAYGKTFAETFPIAYGLKYHTTSTDQLTVEWIGPRMYRPSLEELLRGAFDCPVPETHYIQTYRYPSKGGFVSYLQAFASRFDLRLNHRLVRIDPRSKLLSFANGVTIRYSAVISSIPLPELIPMIDCVPPEVLDASRKLAFSTAVLFNIGLDRADLSDAATTYFYDEDVILSRVNLPHMFSANNAPEGCGSIQAEVYFSDKYKPLCVDPESLFDKVLGDLRRCGFIRDGDKILMMDTGIVRYANVIYDFDRTAALSAVQSFLDEEKIYCCGRYGNWDHAWTDEAFVSGEQAARRVLNQ